MTVTGNDIQCAWCHMHFTNPKSILKYDDKYFCDDECLGQYLVDKVEGEVEVMWFDTEENMRLCAMEDKYDEFL